MRAGCMTCSIRLKGDNATTPIPESSVEQTDAKTSSCTITVPTTSFDPGTFELTLDLWKYPFAEYKACLWVDGTHVLFKENMTPDPPGRFIPRPPLPTTLQEQWRFPLNVLESNGMGFKQEKGEVVVQVIMRVFADSNYETPWMMDVPDEVKQSPGGLVVSTFIFKYSLLEKA